LSAAFLLISMLCVAPAAWAQTAAFSPDFPSHIEVPFGSATATYSNLPVSNVTGDTLSNISASYGFSAQPNPGLDSGNIVLNYTPSIPPNGSNGANVVRIFTTNAPNSNATNRLLTILVEGPPVMPPEFNVPVTSGTNNFYRIIFGNQ
jgi:hypothetical protein